MATTIETVTTTYINFTNKNRFDEARRALDLQVNWEGTRYMETTPTSFRSKFVEVFGEDFARALADEGSEQFILAYTGE